MLRVSTGFVLMLFFSVVFGGVALAGQAGSFTLTPSVGYHVFDGAVDIKDSESFGLAIGYNFNKNWAVEGDVRYTPTEMDDGSGDEQKLWTFSLGALYSLFPDSKLDPYLSLGAGIISCDSEGTSFYERETDEDAFGYWGGGVRYGLSEMAALRLDLRHMMDYRYDNHGNAQDERDWRHRFQAMLGVTFSFDDAKPVPVKKEEPVAEPVAMETPVEGDIDTDSDGVFDSLDKCLYTPPGVRVNSVGCPADTDGDGVVDYLDACIDTPKDVEIDKHGCPKGVEEVASLTLDILFGVNKNEITPFHAAELKRAASFMQKYPMYKVVVEGHTDSTGKASYNQKLSQRRAESVRAALIKDYGFPAEQVVATGYGEEQPVADNGTEEGRADNRRVEISIRPN